MKLIIAVVQQSDVEPILGALTHEGFRATQITSAGGFLRESNVTLLVGVEEHQVKRAIQLIDTHSNARRLFVNPLMPVAPMSDTSGFHGGSSAVRVGASVFVLNISRFERLTE